MKAGRELDGLIAEKVMGLKVYGQFHETNRGVRIHVPRYSTNIEDAWLVVEKLKDKVDIGFFNDSLGNWNCKILDKSDWSLTEIEAETAPLAICLAALKAVDIEKAV